MVYILFVVSFVNVKHHKLLFLISIPTNLVIRVGLLITEELVTASQSNSDLFDNARGFSNFAAPGADRFKISTTLIKKSLDDFDDENFVELLRVEDGILSKFVKDSNYNLIRDELARRTYDESGDYYIGDDILVNGTNNMVWNITNIAYNQTFTFDWTVRLNDDYVMYEAETWHTGLNDTALFAWSLDLDTWITCDIEIYYRVYAVNFR